MNLFTSNFRREFKVIATVMLVAMAGEAGVRLFRPKLSADVLHLRQLPFIAEQMSHAKGLRVLFLGNSLTRRGVNLSLIRQETQASDERGVFFDKVNPDDSAILDWYYLFKKYFAGPCAPDVVVVGWVENQLSDRSIVHPDRIAAYYGGWNTAGEMFSNDLHGIAPRMDYVLSTMSAMYSEKERIRVRLLALAVPDYQRTAQRLNAAVKNGNKTPSALTYTRLDRFLALCAQRHVAVIAAAMPLPKTYPLDPELERTLAAHGATLLDFRHVPGITDADYADGYHLAPRGATLYSEELGRTLAGILPKKDRQLVNARAALEQ